jgi:hypothetical protein
VYHSSPSTWYIIVPRVLAEERKAGCSFLRTAGYKRERERGRGRGREKGVEGGYGGCVARLIDSQQVAQADSELRVQHPCRIASPARAGQKRSKGLGLAAMALFVARKH